MQQFFAKTVIYKFVQIINTYWVSRANVSTTGDKILSSVVLTAVFGTSTTEVSSAMSSAEATSGSNIVSLMGSTMWSCSRDL